MDLRTHRSRTRHPARAGFALVEVMVAMVVLTLCAYLLSATITATAAHGVVRKETAHAADAARNVLEDMRALPFGEIFARYNEDPGDDPGRPGTAPGAHFAVLGLDPLPGDRDGMVGRVVLPSPGPELYESAVVESLLMPRDLNGDGWTDGKDHASDYIILPVQVIVEWNGYSGPRSFSLSTVMAEMVRP